MMFLHLVAIADSSIGVNPSSPLGLGIIFFGIVFTIGLPVLLIIKGRKD